MTPQRLVILERRFRVIGTVHVRRTAALTVGRLHIHTRVRSAQGSGPSSLAAQQREEIVDGEIATSFSGIGQLLLDRVDHRREEALRSHFRSVTLLQEELLLQLLAFHQKLFCVGPERPPPRMEFAERDNPTPIGVEVGEDAVQLFVGELHAQTVEKDSSAHEPRGASLARMTLRMDDFAHG